MTTSKYGANALYTQAASGLQANYYYLMQGIKEKGLSLKNILQPTDEAKKSAYMNYNFASYMIENFADMDADGDGLISESDMNQYTNKMYTMGLTYNQLAQLCSQGGTSTLLETVLNNFSEIDKNGDGRITNAEIAGYNVEKEIEEMKDKYPKIDPENLSIFYSTSKRSEEE